MRSTFKQLFYINRAKVKADGTTAVLCRITIDGKNSVITTGVYCKPEDFNAKKGEVKDGKANGTLLKFRERIGQAYEQILKEQGVISAELLKNTLVGVNAVPVTLLLTGAEELERLEKRSVEIKSRSTYRQSVIFQECLRQYLLSFGKEDIIFSEITEQFGLSYKVFLLKDMGCSTDKMNKCLCWLNRLVYIAVDREIIRSNPLEDVAYEKKNPPRLLHISRGELKLMMETPMEDSMLELARRMFIFSSLTGLAYVDIYRLYPHHIGKTTDNRTYIREKRGKTHVEAFIPLHPIAEQILSLYNTTDDTKPVFPLPIRDIMWHEIHAVGNALKFKENLSHHQARHTFGTLLLSAGISIESIAKMMGHTNIATTQVYAKVTDRKISDDMDRLIGRRKTMNNKVI
ncbi:site-specific integrase [Bacteroides fragilis]|uniref:site-specific integrase n=1 Tax=Bacteroides fragilis TaxID=817 RepID=UPI001879D647|nr:site-specific integrase [Bacteroides fragilis]MBE7399989.1 site-specific integrase [Bacteroides fragilis]